MDTDTSAIRIQCAWRKYIAKRTVQNRKLASWLHNRSALRIQCAARRMRSRCVVQQLRALRRAHREDRNTQYKLSKIRHLQELYLWSATKCDSAASKIQAWYKNLRHYYAARYERLKAAAMAREENKRATVSTSTDPPPIPGQVTVVCRTPIPLGIDEEPQYGTLVVPCHAPPSCGVWVRNLRLERREAAAKTTLEYSMLTSSVDRRNATGAV